MAERGEQVRLWFDRAACRPMESRADFLEKNCADESIRQEVLALLEFDTEDWHEPPEVALSDATIDDVAGAALSRISTPHAPVNRVGPFELGRMLGSGGMGFVYEAHRSDGQVRQRVAVKFVQVPHGAGDDVRRSAHRRFLREREMLASLRHPYIAGLIDAGIAADGTPYAVIEQVDGTPIDAFCDEHHLDRNQRIRLVLKLCEAVQCAHRNLIVHSDIKPDNILVTADGIPKLIDFGVAMDLNDDATLTKFHAFTPSYASPEQPAGMYPTVATDVYGIGAVLYRLLTGAKPREVTNGSLSEIVRQISEEDVIKPSAVRPDLKGDLEHILLKALQRDPQRRYGSVPELADDLKRYLGRLPVRATPDSALYVARKFARRNWGALAAAALLASVFVAATLVSIRQREQALQRAWETRRLADRLLFEVHDEIGGLVGATKAREKLGAIAVQYLESIGRDYRRDPELAWELLNAYARLGQSRGGGASNTGDTNSALRSAAKTLELGAIVEAAGPDAGRLEQLFSAYANVEPVFEDANRLAERKEAIDRMLRIGSKIDLLREARAYKELARYYDFVADPQRSEESYTRALGILRTLSASASKPAGTDTELETTLASYGRSQTLSGNFSGAVASLQEAIALSEKTSASDPQIVRNARHLYWSHVVLGDALGSPVRFSLGRTEDAMEHYRIAASIAERLLRADPDNDVAKLDLARVLARQGLALAASEPVRSVELHDRARELTYQASAQNHTALDSRFEYLTGMIEPLVRLKKLDEAEARLREASDALQQIRQYGGRANERNLLKAQATLRYAAGRRREALDEEQRRLALSPAQANRLISENFDTVDTLQRIRAIAAGLDVGACVAATERLVRIWNDLGAFHPTSDFVQRQVERSRSLDRRTCESSSEPTAYPPAAY